MNQAGRTITVTYNREHPFWREFLDHATDPKVVAISRLPRIRDRQLGAPCSRTRQHRENQRQRDSGRVVSVTEEAFAFAKEDDY